MRLAIFVVLLFHGNTLLAAEPPAKSTGDNSFPETTPALGERRWIHGSSDCSANTDPAIDVFAYDKSTYILRQNKCLTFEAPFIYILIGENKTLVLDTGAIEDHNDAPLYKAIDSILKHGAPDVKELLVIHTHSHGDHYSGDAQFLEKSHVFLVRPSGVDVMSFFGFKDWPNGEARIELGGRALLVIPTPGHQEEAITIYDPQTKWLLTGDTLYPGYIYVKNWEDYKNSIARLVRFSESNEVVALLGSHIEMTREPGRHYPIGTTFQPNEAALDLAPDSLRELNAKLFESKEEELIFDEFIVAPMNFFQKTLSDIARWITQ